MALLVLNRRIDYEHFLAVKQSISALLVDCLSPHIKDNSFYTLQFALL